MSAGLRIRGAAKQDAAALLEIYRPAVEDNVVSFEIETPTLPEFEARIAKALAGWAWLVAEHDGHCVAYAYGSEHRVRAAYRWSVEVSAHAIPDHRRRGIAGMLYTQLFESLARKGYCNAYAGITVPNDASISLHSSVGFESIGVFPSVGRKFGAWHDVAWMHRKLRDQPPSG